MLDLQVFYTEFMADILDEASEYGNENDGAGAAELAFKENAFTKIVIDDLESAGVMESPVACYFSQSAGRNPLKVNAYGFPDEDTRLDLVISDFHPEATHQRLNADAIDRLYKQALRFLELAVKGGVGIADPGHEEHAMLSEIYRKREAFDRVQIILITNGLVVQRKEKERKEQSGPYKVGYEIWDLERLRRLRSSGATHDPVTVDLSQLPGGGIPCVPVKDDLLGYQTCVTILPGQILHDWYEDHGARILELNVRSYLQAKGKINKEILSTLLKTPHLFLAYNNGITIVAEDVILDETSNLITGISGLQIVNGGQTTASIHRAKADNHSDLSHVYVQAKITVVPLDQFEAMVPEISRLSNTQNKVSTVDLGANHPFHIGVERVASKIWAPGQQSMWFYERARGAFQTARGRIKETKRLAFDKKFPVSQRILKDDLARYVNTWDALPHLVSKGGVKNFERFMLGVKKIEKGWEPEPNDFKMLIGKALLYRKAQHIAKILKVKPWGINAVTYTVSLLSHMTAQRIDLVSIWDQHDLSPALIAQLQDWLPRVAEIMNASVGDKNPGEWFKSEKCWLHLQESTASWQISSELSAELVTSGLGYSGGNQVVQNNIARCLQIDASTWLKIQIWGSESGQLKEWQIGIANTLSGYAALGWAKKPSEKQAKHAVVIIELYKQSECVTSV